MISHQEVFNCFRNLRTVPREWERFRKVEMNFWSFEASKLSSRMLLNLSNTGYVLRKLLSYFIAICRLKWKCTLILPHLDLELRSIINLHHVKWDAIKLVLSILNQNEDCKRVSLVNLCRSFWANPTVLHMANVGLNFASLLNIYSIAQSITPCISYLTNLLVIRVSCVIQPHHYRDEGMKSCSLVEENYLPAISSIHAEICWIVKHDLNQMLESQSHLETGCSMALRLWWWQSYDYLYPGWAGMLRNQWREMRGYPPQFDFCCQSFHSLGQCFVTQMSLIRQVLLPFARDGARPYVVAVGERSH